MATLINIGAFGDFNTTTWTRSMSTDNANVLHGTVSIPITPTPIYTSVIQSEGLNIGKILLNIKSVNVTDGSTFTMYISSTSGGLKTYTYYTSALLLGNNTISSSINSTGLSVQESYYWQGLKIGSSSEQYITLPSTVFKLGISCTVSGNITLIGSTSTEFGRIILPEDVSLLQTVANNSVVNIVSYIYPHKILGADDVSVPFNTPTQILFSGAANTYSGITVYNNSLFMLRAGSTCKLSGPIIAGPGSSFVVEPGASIELDNCDIIGLNKSLINIQGTSKPTYTYLTEHAVSATSAFAVSDNILGFFGWLPRDKILFPANFTNNTNTFETLTAKQINEFTFTTETTSRYEHYSLSSVLFESVFKGAPICNTSKNILITKKSGTSVIIADTECSLTVRHTALSGMGSYAAPRYGAVSLLNNSSIIEDCIFSDSFYGVYADTSVTTNFTINNNAIYNSLVHGIFIKNSAPLLTITNGVITNNVVMKSQGCGIATNNTRNIAINSNTLISNTIYGLLINDTTTTLTPIDGNIITSVNGNKIYNNSSTGIICTNSNGSITNSTIGENKAGGIVFTSTSSNYSIGIDSLYSYKNYTSNITLTSTSIDGAKLNVYNLSSTAAATGLYMYKIYGNITNAKIWSNTVSGIEVLDCFYGPLNLTNFTVYNNASPIHFYYPSNGYANFYPVYITNSSFNAEDNYANNTCISLDKTKCEKFAVENTTLKSNGPIVTLTTPTTALIEGSYIFSGCTFDSQTNNLFDDVKGKYQTDVFNETGFVSMYHNGSPTQHYKYLATGTICSDTTIYYDTRFNISEKLTPSSTLAKLRSSKKLIPVDNYDGNIPPQLRPEYLRVSVWVYVQNWARNSPIRLMVATNPHVKIYNDTALVTYAETTWVENTWIQLKTDVPFVTATDIRTMIEVYVDCSGNSGGSINIDKWEHTFTL